MSNIFYTPTKEWKSVSTRLLELALGIGASLLILSVLAAAVVGVFLSLYVNVAAGQPYLIYAICVSGGFSLLGKFVK